MFELMILLPLILLVAVPIVMFNGYKSRKYVEKIGAMSQGQRQLEMSRLQVKMDSFKTSHVLHFLITVLSIGFWVIPWVLISSSNSSSRRAIEKLMDNVVETESAPSKVA